VGESSKSGGVSNAIRARSTVELTLATPNTHGVSTLIPYDAASAAYRLTIDLRPLANPTLDDGKFEFTTPSPQRR
jgi:hypothetical protein